MPRNIKGKPVDSGEKKIDTEAKSNKHVKSREAMPHQKMPHDKPTEEGNSEHPAGDTDNNTEARKNPESVDHDASEMLQLHHDRLETIEKHLGLHMKKGDGMTSQDQKQMGGKVAPGHITEKKGTPHYGRKRH